MDTPLEESNLALVGSMDDKAVKQAAAELEVNWDDAGKQPGIEIWRVENQRTENDNPDFGINPWPVKHHGEFFTGDSYIVLQTQKDDDSEQLLWDIYFWIGSASSQDEYGVAAYKANELDDILGDAPVQHRETEGYESEEFMECFPKGIKYLKGGIASGFRKVDPDAAPVDLPNRLFHLRKINRKTHTYLTELTYESLNMGDAFVLDAGATVYTWYGDNCSPFEKRRAAEVGNSLVSNRHGRSQLVVDVTEDNDDFWNILAGKGPIKEHDEVTDEDVPDEHAPKMCIVRDEGSQVKVEQVEASENNLRTTDVCLIDTGTSIFVWVGTGASTREKQQSMTLVQSHLKMMKRQKNTRVLRVLEGQETRCKAFQAVF